MSELQLSLILIGAVAVAAVYLFNRFQERKYRRDAEKAFVKPPQDVLLEQPAVTRPARSAGAIEKQTAEPIAAPVKQAHIEPTLGLEPEPPPGPELSAAIDYVASLHGGRIVTGREVTWAIEREAYRGKPILWQGRSVASGAWQQLGGPAQNLAEVKAALQLANRGGPASELDIATFNAAVKNIAKQLELTAELPAADSAVQQAAQLDQFCAEVDVLIGINVISAAGAPLPGAKILAFAEAEGMPLASNGVFHLRTEQGEELFSLANHEARPFLPEQVQNITTSGVTFLLDVPRTKDGLKAFDRMVALARRCGDALSGVVVDDNRAPLSEAELRRIRAQLESIFERMASQGIPAGGSLALRLFSQ